MSRPDGEPDRDTTPPPVPPSWVRWRLLAILLAFSFLSWFNRVSMSVAYDERIQGQTGISEEDIGWVYSALLIAYMICMTPGGWLADRRGARLALTVMGLGSAFFVATTGFVGLTALTPAALLLGLLMVRAALGVFTAPIYPASTLAVAHWFPARQRAGANGAIMGAALLGIAFCFPSFGLLIDLFDWPVAFLIVGAVTAVLALLWLWYGRSWPEQHPGVNEAELQLIRPADPAAPPPPQADAEAAPEGWRALLTNRSLILLTVSYAAVGYFEYLFYFWSHYYFEKVLKLGTYESRGYSMVMSLAMAGGMLGGGLLADVLARAYGRRFARATVVVGGMLGGAVLLGCGLWATDPVWITVWFGLAMAAVGATEGPFWATALELGGRRGATAAGIFNTGGNAGGALAPALTPLVSTAFGWPLAIALGSLVCVAGASLWLWIKPDDRRSVQAGREEL